MRRALKRDVLALVVYALLTVVLARPLVTSINTVLAGQSSDVYMNPWADWWTRKALTENLDFFYTDYLFYPQGVSTVFHSFSHVNTMLSLLLTPALGHFAAYNVCILLAFVLSGFSMYLLVKHLTDCVPAALVAGLVFAFHPYHVFESAHPVIVTTQWMPLFALSLVQMVERSEKVQVWQPALTGLWFILTALSSWHLMLMLGGWSALYLAYRAASVRKDWAPGALRSLFLTTVIVGLVLSPFLWLMVKETVGSGFARMSADIDDGIGNDLLGFLIPNRRNPVLHPLASTIVRIDDQTRFTGKRSAYLGYIPMTLTAIGFIASRETRFWVLSGLAALVLSLGAQITCNGIPLHDFYLPWAFPIVTVLRHPFRLSVLTFFSFSIAVGFGFRRLHTMLASRNTGLAHLGFLSLSSLILLEYLVVPFPTMKPSYSPFLHHLSEEEGDFAVADFPMGRQQGKYYMFYQTIHGKRLAGGHVSRKPDSADAFIDTNPLFEKLDDNVAPGPEVNIEEAFENLATLGFRYLIIHKRFLSPKEATSWKSWFSVVPSYEDKWLMVYKMPTKSTRKTDEIRKAATSDSTSVSAMLVRHAGDSRFR